MVGRKRPFCEISTSSPPSPLPRRGAAVEASQKLANTRHADQRSDDIAESTDSETEESEQESTDESEDEVESVPRKAPTFLCKKCKNGFKPMLRYYLHVMGNTCPGKPTTQSNEKSTKEKYHPKEEPRPKQNPQPKQKAAPKEKVVYWCAMPDCAYTTTSLAWFKKHCLKRHNNDQTQPGWDKPEVSDTESTVLSPEATTQATPETATKSTPEGVNTPITEYTPEPVAGPSTPPPPTRIPSPALSLSSLSSLSDSSEAGDSDSD